MQDDPDQITGVYLLTEVTSSAPARNSPSRRVRDRLQGAPIAIYPDVLVRLVDHGPGRALNLSGNRNQEQAKRPIPV